MQYRSFVDFLRPESTFANYEPVTENQETAKKTLMNIARTLIDNAPSPEILNDLGFKKGALFVLSGSPGTGKSHLLEAFVSQLVTERPELEGAIFFPPKPPVGVLGRIDLARLQNKGIIILDDVFSEKQSLEKIDTIDVQGLTDLLMTLYNYRRICFMNTNFPLAAGLGEVVRKSDPTGRVMSRCAALLSEVGEFDMTGPDFRIKLAEKLQQDRVFGKKKDNPWDFV